MLISMAANSASVVALDGAESSKEVRCYYSKKNECRRGDLKREEAVGKQPLTSSVSGHAEPCSNAIALPLSLLPEGRQIELGALYEVDHTNLPPKSPIHLKTIRVVKVTEKTVMDVTVNFPSLHSLKRYFAAAGPRDSNGGGLSRRLEMDERFVMSRNQAGRILRWPVSQARAEEEKHRESFWLAGSMAHFDNPSPLPLPPPPSTQEAPVEAASSPLGPCLEALRNAQVAGWGVRRRIKYIGRHQELSMVMTKVEDDNDDLLEEEGLETAEAENDGEVETRKLRPRSKKRARDHEFERKIGKKKHKEATKCIVKYERGSKDRWSTERYELAEVKLVGIMKAKKAVLGNPILRQQLRDEARRYIGDTGLLDHLLKHMAGKVVTGGTERFRRRHNPEGSMEYWLEPAEFLEIRKKAGVQDPFWVPPPGWKSGDATATCSCGSLSKLELSDLRDELAELKRDVEQQLSSLKKLEKAPMELQSSMEAGNGLGNHQELNDFEGLMEWKAKIESEVATMSDALRALREETQALKANKKKEEEEAMERERTRALKEDKHVAINGSDGADQSIVFSNSTAAGEEQGMIKSRGFARRSGFRICKPHGTFLWPGAMVSGSNSGGLPGSSSPAYMASLSSFGVPTPTSASSVTSAARFPLVPSPTSPLRHQQQQQLLHAAVPYGATNRKQLGKLAAWSGGGAEGHEVSMKMATAAAGSELFVGGGVATELALATPSSST